MPESGERCDDVMIVPLRCELRAGHAGDCRVQMQMRDDVAQLFASGLAQLDLERAKLAHARRQYHRSALLMFAAFAFWVIAVIVVALGWAQ